MELFQQIINSINDVLWSYVMIAALIVCALYFTFRTRFVQFRLIGDMFRQLLASGTKSDEQKGKNVSRRSKPLPFRWRATSVWATWRA